MSPEDGFAAVALGLGSAVVGGGKCLTFCPRYPRHLVQFSSVEDILANSQSEFWALELDGATHQPDPADDLREVRFGLDAAEADGTLHMLGSTYARDNHAIYDGLSRPGARVVSFAPVLSMMFSRLPAILDQLMNIGEDALGRPVEIEFAVRLPQRREKLQISDFCRYDHWCCRREGEEVRSETGSRAASLPKFQSSGTRSHSRLA